MYRKVLIAIDPESEQEVPAALAAGLDQLSQEGELHLVTVVNPDGTDFFPHVPEQSAEEQEAATRAALERMADAHLPSGRSAQIHVAHGAAGTVLVALAGRLGADLLIVISHGAGGRWPLPRHTVEYVAVNAPCAVLVLPGADSEQ